MVQSRKIFAFAAALLVSGSCFAQSTSQADAEKEPVLKAMLAELNRSKQQLQLQDFQKPFFIQYRLDDVVEYQANANYGALTGEQEQHQRVVRVTVRIGNYKLDSSTERGDGSLQIATIEDDPIALRYALWSATDTAYKNALRDYTQKQVALKAVQTPLEADDFSQEKPVVSIEPLVRLDLDRAEWKRRLIVGTELYRTDAQLKSSANDVLYSNGTVRVRVLNRYLVNSEGTMIRKGSAQYMAIVSAGTQASDGMHLDRSYATTGTKAAELDSAEKFHDGVTGILRSLRDLKNAHVVSGEYHGPVLFSGDAASDVLNALFVPAVAAMRPEAGTSQRTRGPYASSYQARVLPDFLKVMDDPGLASFDGKSLFGAYKVDDEGVTAQSISVVESGKLMNYLIGREPVKDFPNSNGHGRAGIAQASHPQMGVLHVEASNALSPEVLEQKLIAMGKDQGLEYVYLVQTFGPELAPRLLYRIHVADGKRELVRGGDLDDLDHRTLRAGIRAAGNDTYIDNVFGDIPQTILTPSLLFEDVTVKRTEEKSEKLPYYAPPAE